jgi:hypothetical protein
LEGCPDVYENNLGYYLGLTQVFLVAAPALIALGLTICVYCTVQKKLADSRAFVFVAAGEEVGMGVSNGGFRARLSRRNSSSQFHVNNNNNNATSNGRRDSFSERSMQPQDESGRGNLPMTERVELQQRERERYRSQKLAAVRTQAILYCLAYWNSFFWYFFY